MFGGFGAEVDGRRRRTLELVVERERAVEAALEADRGGCLRAHAPCRRASPRRGRGRPRRRRAARAAGAASGRAPPRPPSRATARSGRAASPTKSESPVSTSHGSSARVRSMTARHECSGRCPGVWIAAEDDAAELELGAVVERVVLDTRPLRGGGSMTGSRARARAGRGRTGGRRACASRSTRTIRTSRLAASSRYCSIAYGGSTIAATPASSSPTRYEAQPRSSSTNCGEQHGADGSTATAIPLEAAAARREHSTLPPTRPAATQRAAGDRRAQGTRHGTSGAGTTVSAVVGHLRRPRRRRTRRAGSDGDLPGGASARHSARSSGLRARRLALPGRADQRPRAPAPLRRVDPLAGPGLGRSLSARSTRSWAISPCSTRRGCDVDVRPRRGGRQRAARRTRRYAYFAVRMRLVTDS